MFALGRVHRAVRARGRFRSLEWMAKTLADNAENRRFQDTSPAFKDAESTHEDGSTPEPSIAVTADDNSVDGDQVIKICEDCMLSRRDPEDHCPQCGEPLVPIRAVSDSYIGEVINGKYKIVDHLGSGGMAEVYLGINEPLGQQVAVKFLSERFSDDEDIILRFLNEARSYCKVSHPNAVTLLEYGQHRDGALYIVTEYVEGESLTSLVERNEGLPVKHVLSIGMQCCEVLDAAHSQGVIHRDLKPDNIMLMQSTQDRYAVKVLDFGIAKIIDDDRGPMTETGSVFGTPEFMSPEQAQGDSGTPQSDLYALGIILFYMSTSKLPFEDDSHLAVLNQQIDRAPPRPAEQTQDALPVELEKVMLRCLEKKPAKRFGSADELLSALEEVENGYGVRSSSREGGREREGAESTPGSTTSDTRAVLEKIGAMTRDAVNRAVDAGFGARDWLASRENGTKIGVAVAVAALMGLVAFWVL